MASLASSAQAATVPLGTAANFAVLAGSTVTNAGSSVITGDVGVSPGSAVTGFGPGEVVPPSVIYRAGPIPLQAQNDLTTAYNTAAGLSSSEAISTDLAGRTLAPGVYTATSSLSLNGTLTLDANGDPNAVFVFQAGSTLLVGTTTVSSVLLINGAQASNVFWQVGSSATVGVGSAFAGNILALTSITMDTNATLNGRALARNGAVTLDSTTINTPPVAGAPPVPPVPPVPPGAPGGGSCAVQNPGGLASNNGVVLGEDLTGDPAHGGALVASEWLQLGLRPGAETVRRETADGIITTRTDVPCVDGVSSSTLHPEVREMTLPSAGGSVPATFSRDSGSYLGDPNVRQPSDLEASVLLGSSGAASAASGPEAGVLQSWQIAPPGHGTTYERYDAAGQNGTNSEWVDAATHLPLKLTVRSGSVQQSTYWTYDPNTIAPAAFPEDFFELSEPADPGQVEQDDSYPGAQLPASVTDSATGASFKPLSLGSSASVDGQDLCQVRSSLYQFFESGKGFADPGDVNITRVDADYVSDTPGAVCVPGQGDAANAAVQVSTFATGSAAAAANRRSFQDGPAVVIKQGSVSVRVMPGDEQDTLALVNIAQSTVLIRDSLPGANTPGAGRAQILAILSRLLDSETEGSSFRSADSNFAPAGVSPDLRAFTASATKAPALAADFTLGDRLFTGSTYSQRSGAPDRDLREAPVSVAWDGGGTASVGTVAHDTTADWKNAENLAGANMKPLAHCQDPRGIFFRPDASKPDLGQWEQSDPLGYLSTSGPCQNGYLIRLWSSQELHALTHAQADQDEFVMAPIEHDKSTLQGSEVDLSYDKARYRYQKIMSSQFSVINDSTINPESETHTYNGYVYSGIVSQISRRDSRPSARTQLAIAQEHAPELFFDSSERWAPLEVNDYLVEGTHHLCTGPNGSGCQRKAITSPNQLAAPANEKMLMYSGGSANGEDLSFYHSPIAACTKNYQDCNEGPRSRIYSHIVPEGDYLFIDYWIFYRFNDAPDSGFVFDQHEGDWEGLTVAVPRSDPNGPFSYALYRQHSGAPWSYLRPAVRCGDQWHSCGPTGMRPDSFPAAGTHADYVRPCSLELPTECRDTNSLTPDHGRDGSRPWGNNHVGNSVELLDDCYGSFSQSCGLQVWTGWKGNWNGIRYRSASQPGGVTPTIDSPAAGDHLAEYNDPGDLHGTPQCEHKGTCGPGADVSRVLGRSAAAAGIPQVCQSWFGPNVNAMACDPTELAASIQNGTVGTSGSLTIAGPGTSSSGSPGVTQALGSPLTPGQSLAITGSASAGTELFVLTRVDGIVRQVAFTAPALNLGAAQVLVTANGGVTLIRNGYPNIEGSVIHVTNTAAPSRPQLTARRIGNRIFVRVHVRASTKVLVALLGRNGRFLAGRRIVVRRYRTIVFRYRRNAKRAEAVAVGPHDSFSSVVVTTPIRSPAKRHSVRGHTRAGRPSGGVK